MKLLAIIIIVFQLDEREEFDLEINRSSSIEWNSRILQLYDDVGYCDQEYHHHDEEYYEEALGKTGENSS